MKPFLAGRSQISNTSLQGVAAPANRTSSSGPCAGSKAAQIELIKEGDKVVRMVVTCSCGEKIEIDCLYPAGC